MASMHSDHAADDHDESVHHEGSDIDIRAMFISAVALTAMTAFCYGVVLVMFNLFEARAAEASATRQYPLARGQENRLPPEPRLQTQPKQELKDLRAEEALALENYQWVDKTAGVVRIPIEAAKKLTLERGLASRPAPAGAPAAAAPAAAPATPAPAPAPAAH